MIGKNLLKNRNRLTDIEKKLLVTKEGSGGRINEKFGIDQQIQTTKYKIDKQSDPTVQHRELYLVSYNKP